MLDKILILISCIKKRRIIFLFLLVFFSSVLEMLGVGTIPLFLGLILDQSRIIELIQNISFLSFF